MKATQRRAASVVLAALSFLIITVPTLVMAETKTAHQVAENVKNEMIDIINNREKIEAEGEGKYYQAVVNLFEPVVDFNFIAGGVMAKHGKTASEEQRTRFAEVLKTSLMGTVSTYTQGLAGTSGFDINVIPPKASDAGKERVSVGLEVKTGDAVNRLAFTMQVKEEQWKIANMTLNGINLGQTFRIQFDQAVKKAEGDLDKAIDSWSS